MEEQEYYEKAGRIAAEVMEEGLENIEEGGKLLDLANFVESTVLKNGGKLAFPCNISVNAVAAHYSPDAWDESTFKNGDLVKLDIGVHVDGYIADIAKSKIVGSNKNDLIRASEDALKNVIDAIKPGVTTDQLGEIAEKTIRRHGYNPIVNLTGHLLTRWNLHGGIVIPNIKTAHGEVLREGQIFAIEPFATDGTGKVVDGPNAIIFKYLKDRPLRMKEARNLLTHVKNNYRTLPFAERWISNLMPRFKLNQALKQLIFTKAIYPYHILREKEKGLVSQAEHTIIITKNGCKVTTLL
jgi:methionyl aminopeptidase